MAFLMGSSNLLQYHIGVCCCYMCNMQGNAHSLMFVHAQLMALVHTTAEQHRFNKTVLAVLNTYCEQ